MTDVAKPPLDGIRVLDFTRVIAGPLCTQHLADLGADIIKLENVDGGDDTRSLDAEGQPGRSPIFMAFNRSKQSIAVDLKADGGPALALELAKRSDVLIENFRPGVMGRFGLDPDTVRAQNPRLIYTSISAFGSQGSLSERPGLDPVLQAESGMMALTGAEGDTPMRHPLSLIDTLTASHAFGAICAALIARERTGAGDFIDLSLMDTAYAALGNAGLHYLVNGTVPRRSGNSHIQSTPADLFPTKTDPIYIAVGTDRNFGKFCRDVIERPALVEDPRFASSKARFQHRAELLTLIKAILIEQPAAYWLPRLRHLPAGAVRTIDVALESPEAQERELVRTIDDHGKPLRLLSSPLRFTEAPMRDFAPPPHHGEHTDAVLARVLDMPADEIDALRRRGVVK